jgi:hypothetical protein
VADLSGGRRFLLATAACRYPRRPEWDRQELEADVQRIIELFTGIFGYRHVPLLGLNPTKAQLETELRGFCRSPDRQPDDYIAVYLAGHGEVLEQTSNDHVLLPSDVDPDDLAFSGLRTGDLARILLEGTPVRRLLLLLDTCLSGDGSAQLVAKALEIDLDSGEVILEPHHIVDTTRVCELLTA